jgi:hypothetical protein
MLFLDRQLPLHIITIVHQLQQKLDIDIIIIVIFQTQVLLSLKHLYLDGLQEDGVLELLVIQV